MADEQPEREELQARRARQYAVCTYALDYDRASDGAEGVFDQALTNGLAAIVAHEWPGEEVGRGGRMLAASKLLDVVEKHGKHKDDGIVAILRPGEPEYTQYPFEDEPMPNYTAVNVPVLRDALSATQAIRHARETDEPTDAGLTGAHIAALGACVFVGETRPRLLLSDKSLRLHVGDDVDPLWLRWALGSGEARKQMSQLATGTSDSMRNLSQDKLKAIRIQVPPLETQKQVARNIALQLGALRRLERQVEREEGAARRLERSVLRDALLGHALLREISGPVEELA